MQKSWSEGKNKTRGKDARGLVRASKKVQYLQRTFHRVRCSSLRSLHAPGPLQFPSNDLEPHHLVSQFEHQEEGIAFNLPRLVTRMLGRCGSLAIPPFPFCEPLRVVIRTAWLALGSFTNSRAPP